MTYQYKLTPLAVLDINDALDYISDKLRNPGAAKNLYRALQKEIAAVCYNPFSFPDCSYYLIDSVAIRHSVAGNYVLIFEVSKSEKLVKILRFLYGGMDISHMPVSE